MPKDYKSFCLVAEHLVKNAHRYYKKEEIAEKCFSDNGDNVELKKEIVELVEAGAMKSDDD